MPKEITHLHIAELVRNRASGSMQEILARHDRAYAWGSVAPDLFYYDLPVPGLHERSQAPWGEIIHGREGEDTMAHLLLLLEQSREVAARGLDSGEVGAVLLAFVAGYLTHVAADTVFHPFVYSMTGNYYAPGQEERRLAESRHRLFETGLDMYVLKLRGQDLPEFRLSERLALTSVERHLILNAFADALREAHRPGLDPEHVRRVTHRAFRRSRLLISLFQKAAIVRALIAINRMVSGRISEIAHLGYGPHHALQHLDYAHPGDVPHPVTGDLIKGDVNSMIEESTRRGIAYVDAIQGHHSGKMGKDELRRILRPLSLNNGLEGTPTRAMRFSHIHPALLQV